MASTPAVSSNDGPRQIEADFPGPRELQKFIRFAAPEVEAGDDDVGIGGDPKHLTAALLVFGSVFRDLAGNIRFPQAICRIAPFGAADEVLPFPILEVLPQGFRQYFDGLAVLSARSLI